MLDCRRLLLRFIGSHNVSKEKRKGDEDSYALLLHDEHSMNARRNKLKKKRQPLSKQCKI